MLRRACGLRNALHARIVSEGGPVGPIRVRAARGVQIAFDPTVFKVPSLPAMFIMAEPRVSNLAPGGNGLRPS